MNASDESLDQQTIRQATRRLARLPRWRESRRRLYRFVALSSPICGILLWLHLSGPDWLEAPISGPVMMTMVVLLPFVFLWDWLSVKSKRAVSVVLDASAPSSVGPILDATCLVGVNGGRWEEVNRTLIDRLRLVTSPEDDFLTNTQLSVLHDIVQRRHLRSTFGTDSHCIILKALVHLGDARSVTCLEELIRWTDTPIQSAGMQAKARQYLISLFGTMGRTRFASDMEKVVGEPGKTRDYEVVRAMAQECLVRLRARLADESLRASLLRSSEPTAHHDATLLRPAAAAADATPSEQLLRSHSQP